VRRDLLRLTSGLLAGLALVAAIRAQDDTGTPRPAEAARAPQASHAGGAPRAFGIGETATYDVAVGGARVGEGSMSIVGTEKVRGVETYHSVLTIEGGLLIFRVNDKLESWFDPTAMISHRFSEDINEGAYHRSNVYEIYPDKKISQREGKPEEPSVENPLDDASFFYFVRTVPLVVGETYVFERYYRPEKNPVIVKVLRRERVKVKAGTFETIVIQPIIKSGGIFADGGEAYMWLTDDHRHIMVQFKAKVKYLHSLDLYLKSYTPPPDSTSSP